VASAYLAQLPMLVGGGVHDSRPDPWISQASSTRPCFAPPAVVIVLALGVVLANVSMGIRHQDQHQTGPIILCRKDEVDLAVALACYGVDGTSSGCVFVGAFETHHGESGGWLLEAAPDTRHRSTTSSA